MKRTFFQKGERIDALSIAGEDMWQYEAYEVLADVYIKGSRAEIPVVKSSNPDKGNFKKWLDEMEKEFKKIQFNTVISPILAKYLTKRGYKMKLKSKL